MVQVLPILLIAGFLWGVPVGSAADNCTRENKIAVCTDESVQERAEWACRLVETKGAEALKEIQTMRYACCGDPNYVWVNDLSPKMILHPIKTTLNGKDLSQELDAGGKRLFVEFVNAVNKTPTGAWVDYYWPKFGDAKSSPKKSWVKKCKVGATNEYWVVGSGTWKVGN